MKIQHIFLSHRSKGWLACVLLACLFAGCKKSLDINPLPTTLNSKDVFTNNGGAQSVIAGMYVREGNNINGGSGISINMGLAADELLLPGSSSTTYAQFYTNSLSPAQNYFWVSSYSAVYVCNTAIQGLTSSAASSMTPAIRQQLLGEAKFSRAFLYFYLVNLYGDVALAITDDENTNSSLPRTAQAQVYQQIIQDLKDAQGLLPDGAYATANAAVATDRVRPNKQAASALLARVYLYQGDWADAETQANDVLGKSIYYLEPVLSNVFLKTSHETIWQLQQFNTYYPNNADAPILVVTTPPGNASSQLPLNNPLVNAFDSVNDKRWTNWIGEYHAAAATYYYAYKYKNNTAGGTSTEYPVVLRLAEQYLIRAEARAQQNNLTGAISDLNTVRTRAGLAGTTATIKSDILTAILHERQLELFTEFGHRWFDLKRTSNLDGVMGVVTPLKGGGAWNSYDALLPVPSTDIALDPNLTQNSGY